MTGENQPNDGIKRTKRPFNPLEEKRPWSAATTEDRCYRIARNTRKRLIEIIDTEETVLMPIICIFEGEINE